MTILKNSKHEKFSQELAKGMTNEAAYVAAGYAPSASNAHRLRQNEKILARVTEIQAQGAEIAGVTVARVLEELTKIAMADITDAVEWGEAIPTQIPDTDDLAFVQGVRMKPSESLPQHVRAAISEIRKTKEGITVKFHSKTAALEQLGRHLGMFSDKLAVTATMTLEQLVLERVRRFPSQEGIPNRL